MKALQQPNGSFSATEDGSECDTRFVYCACAISTYLNDWSAVNQELATQYILNCITYEGGISLIPDSEAHGGSTYCGVASLVLMNKLATVPIITIESLKYWCISRQIFGYQGRTNKDADSCYSYWIGSTLKLLNCFELTDIQSTKQFLIDVCQYEPEYGGFCKQPDAYPDVLHTFYSLSWLSLTHFPGLKSLDPSLTICTDKVK